MRMLGVTVAAMVLFYGAAKAEGQGGIIKAAGSALISVMPDQGRVHCVLQAEDKQTSVAREQLAQKTSAALKAVRALNIEGMQVSTDSFSVTPLVKPPKGAPAGGPGGPPGYYDESEYAQAVIGYRLRTSLTVSVHGSPEVLAPVMSRIIDVLAKDGTTHVTGPYFSCRDDTLSKRQGIKQATQDAVENARAVAEGLGVTVKGFSYAGLFPQTETEDTTIGELAGGTVGDGNDPPATPTPIEIRALQVTYYAWVTATY
jgi:uncharacterized protein YggE